MMLWAGLGLKVLECHVSEQHPVRTATREFWTGMWYDCLFLLFLEQSSLQGLGAWRTEGVMMREAGTTRFREKNIAFLRLVIFGKLRQLRTSEMLRSILDTIFKVPW